MTVIIFLIVLGVLIFVHELGHFLVARACGIRVDAFALGFGPKIFSKTVGETTYSLNIIPFGGYVRIFGENPDYESINGEDKERSFVYKNKIQQILVLFAGIAFNFIFAFLLTIYAFSTENWRRPQEEIDGLFALLKQFVRNDLATLHKNGVRIRIQGRRQGLNSEILSLIDEAEEKTKNKLANFDQLILRDPEGTIMALLKVSQIWKPDKTVEAGKVYGTTNSEHPGVDYLFNQTGEYYVGGELVKLAQPKHYDFLPLRKTPEELKALFKPVIVP